MQIGYEMVSNAHVRLLFSSWFVSIIQAPSDVPTAPPDLKVYRGIQFVDGLSFLRLRHAKYNASRLLENLNKSLVF